MVTRAADITNPTIAVPTQARKIASLRIDKLLNVAPTYSWEELRPACGHVLLKVTLGPVLDFNGWLGRNLGPNA